MFIISLSVIYLSLTHSNTHTHTHLYLENVSVLDELDVELLHVLDLLVDLTVSLHSGLQAFNLTSSP